MKPKRLEPFLGKKKFLFESDKLQSILFLNLDSTPRGLITV